MHSSLDHLVGQLVSQYQIVKKLGAGGMGLVYVAEDTRLERTVALKFLPPYLTSDDSAVARFLSEAKAASTLDHPNICTIYEVGETSGGLYFIAMAHYEGETLRRKIARGPLPHGLALNYATQIARGLSRAHERGIVHRDIKPANVIVTSEGVLKILDFGLAKVTNVNVTQPGMVLGTGAYMSPEQARGQPIDNRTDIWAWGVVLYEMLTGQRAFKAETAEAVLYRVVHEQPDLLADSTFQDLPLPLEHLLNRCLAKDRGLRFDSMDDLLVELESLHLDAGVSSTVTRSATEGSLFPTNPRTSIGSIGITIAVLPFADMSPEKDQEYFSDGMSEELSDSLAKIDRWRVVARTSAFSFKGKDLDVRQIGRQLGATHLLAGSIRKAGDRLRVRVELVDVATGLLLWSEKYHRELDDLFAIQEDIAQSIVTNLKIKLDPVEEAQLVPLQPSVIEAHNQYLKARFHFNKRTETDLELGQAFCERAIEQDPGYAPAYACLADCLLLLGFHGAAAPRDVMPAAKAAAEKALELNDTLAEAHTTLGCIRSVYDWDWAGAKRSFKKALAINSNDATAHHWCAVWYLMPTRQFDKAMRALKTALKLDPVSLILNAVLGWHHYFTRQFDDAVEALQKTLEIDENFVVAHDLLGQAYLQKGMLEEAIAALKEAVRLSDGRMLSMSSLGHACAVTGSHDEARLILEELASRAESAYVSSYDIALVHAGLGEHEQALDYLEQAFEERSGWLGFLNIEPRWDDLRKHARFQQLLEQIGLS